MVNEQITQPEAIAEGAPEQETSMWYESLPDDLKTNKNITKFKSLEDFASWQANASKLMGKKVQDMSADEIRQFVTPEELLQAAETRGMPRSLEEYEVPLLQNAPVSQEVVSNLKKVAFENHITPKQVEALLEFNARSQAEQLESQRAMWTNQLLEKYGSKVGETMGVAQEVARRYMSPQLMSRLDAAGLGHDPEIIEALARVGRDMMPDNIPRGNSIQTSIEAKTQQEINTLLADPSFYRKWKQQDSAAVAQLNGLYKKLGA